MKQTIVTLAFAVAAASGTLVAQEAKPVPKDSMRVTVPGCTKGVVFTAAPRTEDQPGRADIPEGMHLRMNAPKKLMTEIKAHEGQMIQITGLMKKGQFNPQGVAIGGGVRIMPGSSPAVGGVPSAMIANTPYIDLESWEPAPGECRLR